MRPLACRINEPKSLRTIGQACAEKPIALAIPCHHVVGQRKRALINREMMAVEILLKLVRLRHVRGSFATGEIDHMNIFRY
jgi:6-O-methylguanine DNA methyltransferase, DNA binding domain